MADEPYKDPEHAIPYLKLIRLGVPTWNKWIKGELTEEEAADLAEKLAPTPVPTPPTRGENEVDTTNPVNFSGVQFIQPGPPNFSGACMGNRANFEGTHFFSGANFRKANFGIGANFNRAEFGLKADFSDAVFGMFAEFISARFGNEATFESVKFNSDVSFQGAGFYYAAQFKNANFITRVDFNGAVFLHSDFSACKFKRFAIFTNAIFHEPPEFDGWEGAEKADWIGASFKIFGPRPKYMWFEMNKLADGWAGNVVNYPTRLRRLRKIMEEANAHDVAHDLFVLERKSERGVKIEAWRGANLRFLFGKRGLIRRAETQWDSKLLLLKLRLLLSLRSPWGPILLLEAYDRLSDCGRSAKRPLGKFACLNLTFFLPLYLLLADSTKLFEIFLAPSGVRPMPWGYLKDIFSFTLGHALPFATSLSPVQAKVMERLFGKELEMPLCIELLSIIQSLIGALLLFLFLQAIRNHFRLR
ncbi:MAG: pentapeptide repeat-containing protein [Alphaproteobacteria bacterium]|nr:pentapeptide repeat-containing protein [Alphaproteobacteria bacterium]